MTFAIGPKRERFAGEASVASSDRLVLAVKG
jgi:hypothetical protein